MSENNPFKPPDGFDQKETGKIPDSFSTPSTQGRANPDGKNALSPTYRNPTDPPGFGTKEPLDPAYRNPLDPANVGNSMADSPLLSKSQDPFKTRGKK